MSKRSASFQFPIAADGGQWVSEFVYRDDEGTWLTVTGAVRTHREAAKWLGGGLLTALKAPSRFLDGKTIRHKSITPPAQRCRDTVTVFFSEDVSAIADGNRRSNPPKRWFDEKGRPWMTLGQVMAQKNVSQGFIRYWTNKASRLRPGEAALRSCLAPNVCAPHGGPARVQQYLEEDIERILRGEECNPRRLGAGRRSHPLPGWPRGRADCKDILRAILATGPLLKTDAVRQARQRGLGHKRVYQAARDLNIKRIRKGEGEEVFWCLPHQTAPRRPSPYADVVEWLRSTLANGPLASKDVLGKAELAGINRSRLYRGLEASETIRTCRTTGGAGYWLLPGQSVPESAPAKGDCRTETQESEADPDRADQAHRKPGRPHSKEKPNRDEQILADYRSGAYPSKKALADAHGLDRSTVSKILTEHGVN